MTERQEKILKYIIEYINEHNYCPSNREIRDKVNVKSTSTISRDLNELKKLGYIDMKSNMSRSITVLINPFDDYLESNSSSENDDVIMVPKLGDVAAGLPIHADDHIEEYIPLPSYMNRKGNLFFLTVNGDSMINVGIFNGDNVLVREQNTASDGEIVVCLIDNDATVKKYYKRNNIIELRPENDNMESMFFENVIILGKVVGLLRMM